MTDGIKINMVGIPEFSARLRAFSIDMQKKVIRSGAMAAAAVFRNAARNNTPVSKLSKRGGSTPGTLKKSIFAGRSKTRSKPGTETYTVGARGGAGKTTRKNAVTAYYWRWVEAGHLVRGAGKKLKGGDKSRALQRERLKTAGAKFVPPNAFLRRAFQSKQSEAINAFNKRIEARIQKAQKDLNVR